MYQKTFIIGNLGRDPELKYTQSGVAVCDFSVACNESWTDKTTNEKRQKTTWFRVTAWRGLAENLNRYLKKGSLVFIEGTMSTSAYVGNDGEARSNLELTAQTVKFLNKVEGGDTFAEDMAGELGGVVSEDEDLPF